MHHVPIKESRTLLAIPLAATALAAFLTFDPQGWLGDVIMDSLTGALAAFGALFAGVRLALGVDSQQGRRLWQCILAIFVLVAIGEFVEPYTDQLERQLGLDIDVDIDHLLLLAVAPIALWFISKLEPMPRWASASVIAGFILQIAATILDVYEHTTNARAHVRADLIELYTDMAQFLSMQFYMLAAFLIIAEVKAYQLQGNGAIIEDRIWPPATSMLAPLRYRNRPISRLRRTYNRALWRSLPLWKLPIAVVAIPVWPFAVLASSIRQLRRHGGRTKALSGRSYRAQMADHFVIGVTANFWPNQYYKFELYRPELRPRAYEYLRRTETKRGLFKLLRYDHSDRGRFGDKLLFFQACEEAGVRSVPVILAVEHGAIVHPDSGRAPSLPRAGLFLKPRSGRGGSGAEIVRYEAGGYVLMDGRTLTEEQLIAELMARSVSCPLLVEPRLTNHPALSAVHMNALATVRVLTATDVRGRGKVLAAALRMPSRAESVIDNFHAGGIASAVDIETGALGPATDLGLKDDTAWHRRHPVTDGQIEGLRVPHWQEMVQLAEISHTKLADRIVIGWDIAPLPDGPCIIEANAAPDLDIIQRTMRAPLGNGELGRLMAYHLEAQAAASR
jgi:hypothetical protein